MVSCAADGLARRPAPTSEDSTSLFSPRSKPEAHYKKSLPCHPTDGPASDEFLRACSHSANHRPRIARETKQPRRSRTSLSQVAHAHHQHTRGKTPRGREIKRKEVCFDSSSSIQPIQSLSNVKQLSSKMVSMPALARAFCINVHVCTGHV